MRKERVSAVEKMRNARGGQRRKSAVCLPAFVRIFGVFRGSISCSVSRQRRPRAGAEKKDFSFFFRAFLCAFARAMPFFYPARFPGKSG
jgi:hypothetical protein